MTFREKLQDKMCSIDVVLSDLQLDQFEKYYHMLIETNKSMNLTAITEEDDVIVKHFVDSVTCKKIVNMDNIHSVIDVGTGGGFPGIPLKIIYPQISFVLMDSLNKRILFLQNVISELGLADITAVHGRAEDLARKPEYRAQFDLCVSRAVANLSTLTEYCIPFVRVNGFFVSYKSKRAYEEITQAGHCLKILGCKVEDQCEFSLPDVEDERVLINIKKCKGTPKAYPRKAGTPAKNPL